jgi:hypothetical protein
MLVTRQWLHLKMLRRAGRFLKPGGAEGTQAGELAVRCRSCPIDGVNMMDNWKNRPTNLKYVHLCLPQSRFNISQVSQHAAHLPGRQLPSEQPSASARTS